MVAVELDPALASGLRRRFAARARVTVVEGDVLRVALPREPFRVVANVPFNASTAILQRLLDPMRPLERADLVLQWEVARKRAGRPRSALSAAWAPWWRFRLGRRIPPDAFRPRPAVAAAVLTAERRRSLRFSRPSRSRSTERSCGRSSTGRSPAGSTAPAGRRSSGSGIRLRPARGRRSSRRARPPRDESSSRTGAARAGA